MLRRDGGRRGFRLSHDLHEEVLVQYRALCMSSEPLRLLDRFSPRGFLLLIAARPRDLDSPPPSSLLPSPERQAFNLLHANQDRTLATVIHIVGCQFPHGLSGSFPSSSCPFLPRSKIAGCYLALLLGKNAPFEPTVGVGFHSPAYLSLRQDCI